MGDVTLETLNKSMNKPAINKFVCLSAALGIAFASRVFSAQTVLISPTANNGAFESPIAASASLALSLVGDLEVSSCCQPIFNNWFCATNGQWI